MIQTRFSILSQIKIHYLEEGDGDVFVLLHAWPQTSHSCRHVIAKLSSKYLITAPDMRGEEDSSCPLLGYDNGTFAGDVIELLDALGVKNFSLSGHEWVRPVAFAATFTRNRVKELALVDTILIGNGRRAGREPLYLSWFYDEISERGGAGCPDDLAEYMLCYSQPGAMRCGFERYRTLEVSSAFVQARIEGDGEPTIPVLSVAGGAGRGRADEETESMGQGPGFAHHSRVRTFIPEEAPDELCDLPLPSSAIQPIRSFC